MVLSNGRFTKIGIFIAQLCLDTQVSGNIGGNVSFDISSIARKTMVEMLYGASQWDILQVWFISCSIVSRYSTTMTNEIFPLMVLNCNKNNVGDDLWCSLMGDSPSLVFFLINCV